MTRLLYNVLFFLAIPFILLRLFIRSIKQTAYRKRILERFGIYPIALKECIWFHAASVGETNACAQLVEIFQKNFPERPMLITTITPTGSARVRQLFGDRVYHVYLSYDLPLFNKRFLRNFNPLVGVIMETELWPNLISSCHQKNIRLCLTNARLSAESAEKYRKIPALMREMLSGFHHIAANSDEDALRFLSFGIKKEKMIVTGNLKYDLQVDQALQDRALQFKSQHNRLIWIAASTHEGEEIEILKAHRLLLDKVPSALLILVPRHPERFESVAAILKMQGFTLKRRSQDKNISDCEVYLGDSMGELMWFYALSDIAFVGGSLVKIGGHNLAEPASLQKPIITGKYLFNFSDMSQKLLRAEALEIVDDSASLAKVLKAFYADQDLMHRKGKSAKAVIDANRGALQKQFEMIKTMMM